jgi:hypothetical protein
VKKRVGSGKLSSERVERDKEKKVKIKERGI